MQQGFFLRRVHGRGQSKHKTKSKLECATRRKRITYLTNEKGNAANDKRHVSRRAEHAIACF